ncbi:MAG: LLM class F420-dependent oxidoreductase [Proteobacteria bacterium]|nr:LLM class F420-dependent oxidoreductase [Pseudomonadota bacterium]
MDFGVMIFPTDGAIAAPTLARAAEERGLESLWLAEHTHIPVSRRTPFPGGGELPSQYWHTLDPFVVLAAAAAVTSRLRLATGICLVSERDPIVLAKEVASLDHLSNGRVLFGIGAGWNVEELEDHGLAFSDRWKAVRERVLAMRALWTQDEAEYHGQFVDFEPCWSWPKPIQPGGPPVILGADSKWAFDRIAEYCDGWMPIYDPRRNMDRRLEALSEALERRGRSLSDMDISHYGVPPKLSHAEKACHGVNRVVLSLPAGPESEVLPILDECAEIAAKLA